MKINTNTTYILELFVVDKKGEPVTGLTTTYSIYKSSDNSLISSGNLTEIGNGIYSGSYQFNTEGQFRIIYNTPSGYTDEIETVIVEDSYLEILKNILGLTQHNYYLYDTTYTVINEVNKLVSSKVRIFDTVSDLENNINPRKSYQVDVTYDTNGRIITLKQKEI